MRIEKATSHDGLDNHSIHAFEILLSQFLSCILVVARTVYHVVLYAAGRMDVEAHYTFQSLWESGDK